MRPLVFLPQITLGLSRIHFHTPTHAHVLIGPLSQNGSNHGKCLKWKLILCYLCTISDIPSLPARTPFQKDIICIQFWLFKLTVILFSFMCLFDYGIYRLRRTVGKVDTVVKDCILLIFNQVYTQIYIFFLILVWKFCL